MFLRLSVIICTHNPRPQYLERTLSALREQTLDRAQWELLLIDNASKESVATDRDLCWHPRGRHLREERLVLTPTRLRGIPWAMSTCHRFIWGFGHARSNVVLSRFAANDLSRLARLADNLTDYKQLYALFNERYHAFNLTRCRKQL